MSKEKQLYEILLNLQNGVFGTDMAHVQILRLFTEYVDCPACYGAGVVPGEIIGCYHCAGTGKVANIEYFKQNK